MRTTQSNPIAVLISDVHYSLATFHIADVAFRAAIDKAADLGVPLIDGGDLTNDKSLLRAEYVNALIATMKYAAEKGVRVYCLVGNHSLTNEKASDHALHFLEPYCTVISQPGTVDGFNFIPYQNTAQKFVDAIQQFRKGSIVVAHQGTIGGQLGDYVKDTSAFDPDLAADWRVFLGHYHCHYVLKSTVSIGNPYTLTFGEAKDGLKGFLILNADGSFARELLDLRRHNVLERTVEEVADMAARGPAEAFHGTLRPTDLVWLKVKGPYAELQKLRKRDLASTLFGHANFKLDKIYTDVAKLEDRADVMSPEAILDEVIDNTDDSPNQKAYLKALAREVLA